MYKGPVKTVGISDIIDESDYGYKVRLEISGREVWIPFDIIVNAAPATFIVPEWYYFKVLAPLEEIKQSDQNEIPF